LGIAVGDVILMLSYAVYSVISAEGCASILWRDASFASQAATALKITAPSQLELGIIDEIIPEPLGGAHRNPEAAASEIKRALLKHLKKITGTSASKLVGRRFEKFSGMGKFNK